jgi:hypothetical protein
MRAHQILPFGHSNCLLLIGGYRDFFNQLCYLDLDHGVLLFDQQILETNCDPHPISVSPSTLPTTS